MDFFKIIWNPNTNCAYTKKTIYSNPILRCPKCKQLIKDHKIYDFSVMLSKEAPLSDLVTTLYSIPIISKKAYEIFKKENITGFKAHKIQVCNSKGKAIDVLYYALEYTGRISINYNEMGLMSTKCDECGMDYIENKSFIYEKLCLDDSTWDSSDMCVGGYCTSKVIDIVKENNLTGFMFKPAEDAWNSLKRSEIIIK